MRRSGLLALAACLLGLFVGHARLLAPGPVGAAGDDGADADRPQRRAVKRGESADGPAAGDACTVYLRGDAAGAFLHDRQPDLGRLIARRGTLVGSGADWLVLERADGAKDWIPRASIMLVEVSGDREPE